MEWKLFDGWIDEALYGQMMEMIYLSCARKDKDELNRENKKYGLFPNYTGKRMEAEYGLHYPGEVLERLEEHRKVGKEQMRALGLALAKTKNLQEEGMFIGNQLPVFWKKLDRILQEDVLFLNGIRYLLEGKKDKGAYEALLRYPFCAVSEIAFALFILPEDDGLWEKIRGKLNGQLGKERKISVYENQRLYIWLVQNFQFRVEGYRKKDMDALKYLMRLPFGNAFGKTNAAAKKLLENGYSRDEILFLNSTLVQKVYLPKSVDAMSITGEKIAVETCRYFLDAEGEYPKEAYQLCSQLCTLYSSFEIKIGGFDGIACALENVVTAKHTKAFRVLYPLTKKIWKWKRIDLTDSRWDDVCARLPEKEYDDCVQITLEALTDTEKLSKSLERYRLLTGKEYSQRFWESQSHRDRKTFRHLAGYGMLPVVGYMEQFLEAFRKDEENAKDEWKNLLWYLHDYVKEVQSHEAYAILELYVKEIGVNDLNGIFEITSVMESLFTEAYGSWHYGRSSKKLEFFRPFLDAKEHRQVFQWIDEFVFRNDTEYYLKFLEQFLSYEDHLLWFPKETAREIFLCLQASMGTGRMPGALRKLYLTEEEQKELRCREQLRKDRRALKEKMDAVKSMKKAFTKTVSGSRQKDGQFKEIQTFVKNSLLEKKEAEKSAASYLRALFAKERIFLHSRAEMEELFQLLSMLYRSGAVELETVKEFVGKTEEQRNEERDIKAHTDGQ